MSDIDLPCLSDLPLTLGQVVLRAAEAWPDRPAAGSAEQVWSFRALAQRANHWAQSWLDAGLQPGDCVGVWLDKRLDGVAAMLGVLMAGGVLVPINPVLKAAQVHHILRDCDAWGLVTLDNRWSVLAPVWGQGPDSGPSQVAILPAADDGSPWQWLQPSCAPVSRVAAKPDGLAVIFYTSGSTGLPKGVMVSHRNLIAGAVSVSSYLSLCPDDVLLAVLPLSFDAGFSQLTTALWSGAQVALLNHLFPQDVLKAIARHRVTGITAVPPLFSQLVALEWPEGCADSLRFWANTGGRMPIPVLRAMQAKAPQATPFLMYGLTEAFRSTYLPPQELSQRPDSMGRAIPYAEVHVINAQGQACAPGEIGELVHAGPLVSLGYWRRPEDQSLRFRSWPPAGATGTQETPPEQAVYSGDLVRKDEDGFLYFVGRTDEMIKTSGYRVSPTEVEQVALASGLAREAVAIGLDDPALGQKICLAVSALAGGEAGHDATRALLAHFRQHAPAYLCPRHVVWVSEDLPRNPNGKLDRVVWRSHAWI
ncbi:acyl-CoA ligase (AMP-forming), exosortase A system-associated [Aquabacterium lacunae]|uniref:Acyl-CoA ligase (AMP-forming), exosortase A system-associated n=1 Tax=Aquabacterium lacunae TaxID=2528630 RepID=A0A4Q9GZF6_9BURK|nr:acyl-CoA ligase (AMP-forming), exosortase A system-associated [Aquabacterium lacunae]TBO30225.1 acyl-CoA ligase (AMP-forming), exosortase A system-associated [Aquabacterium lacunae]